MKKYTNKYWLREKEFISLIIEEDYIYSMIGGYRYRIIPNQRLVEIKEKLHQKFYNEYVRRNYDSPKWYKKIQKRTHRYKSKRNLNMELCGYDVLYDSYKCGNRYW